MASAKNKISCLLCALALVAAGCASEPTTAPHDGEINLDAERDRILAELAEEDDGGN